MYRDLSPHYGFKVLKNITEMKNMKSHFVLTSNVDGHFQKAGKEQKEEKVNQKGFLEDRICECHGSIHYMQCSYCKQVFSASGKKKRISHEKNIRIRSEI